MNKISFTRNPLLPPETNRSLQVQASTLRPVWYTKDFEAQSAIFAKTPSLPKMNLFVSLGFCEFLQQPVSAACVCRFVHFYDFHLLQGGLGGGGGGGAQERGYASW